MTQMTKDLQALQEHLRKFHEIQVPNEGHATQMVVCLSRRNMGSDLLESLLLRQCQHTTIREGLRRKLMLSFLADKTMTEDDMIQLSMQCVQIVGRLFRDGYGELLLIFTVISGDRWST